MPALLNMPLLHLHSVGGQNAMCEDQIFNVYLNNSIHNSDSVKHTNPMNHCSEKYQEHYLFCLVFYLLKFCYMLYN